MSLQFVDTFLNMKIDECEESIKELTEKIADVERRLLLNPSDDKYVSGLANEYYEILERRHNLARSLTRLYGIVQKRNIDAMVNDPELNKETHVFKQTQNEQAYDLNGNPLDGDVAGPLYCILAGYEGVYAGWYFWDADEGKHHGPFESFEEARDLYNAYNTP